MDGSWSSGSYEFDDPAPMRAGQVWAVVGTPGFEVTSLVNMLA